MSAAFDISEESESPAVTETPPQLLEPPASEPPASEPAASEPVKPAAKFSAAEEAAAKEQRELQARRGLLLENLFSAKERFKAAFAAIESPPPIRRVDPYRPISSWEYLDGGHTASDSEWNYVLGQINTLEDACFDLIKASNDLKSHW